MWNTPQYHMPICFFLLGHTVYECYGKIKEPLKVSLRSPPVTKSQKYCSVLTWHLTLSSARCSSLQVSRHECSGCRGSSRGPPVTESLSSEHPYNYYFTYIRPWWGYHMYIQERGIAAYLNSIETLVNRVDITICILWNRWAVTLLIVTAPCSWPLAPFLPSPIILPCCSTRQVRGRYGCWGGRWGGVGWICVS